MDIFFDSGELNTEGGSQRILFIQKLIDFSFLRQFLGEATFWKSVSWEVGPLLILGGSCLLAWFYLHVTTIIALELQVQF